MADLFDYEILHSLNLRSDDLGLLVVLNDLWKREPVRFGVDEAARNQLFQEIEQTLINGISDRRFFAPTIIAEIFKRRHINPLEDISIINVSPVALHELKWKPLTDLCSSYQPIAAVKGLDGTHVTTANANQLTGGAKVDYVITGNVINYPDNKDPADTIRACAMMLKKGGKSIHLLDIGSDTHEAIIMNKSGAYNQAEQHFFGLIPEGSCINSAAEPVAAIAEQKLEIAYAPVNSASNIDLRGRHGPNGEPPTRGSSV
ncbi:MAG: hypothetical protein ACOYJ2_08125 [Rickettsiales bacterium]